MNNDSQNRPSDTAIGVGAVILIGLCCAGPVLVAAGALGAIGSFLGNPVVILAAVVLAGAGVVAAVRRRLSPRDAGCCEPSDQRPSHERDERGSVGASDPSQRHAP